VRDFLGRRGAVPRNLRGVAIMGPELLELGDCPRFTAVVLDRGFACAVPLLLDGAPSLRDAQVQRRALGWISGGHISFVRLTLPGGAGRPRARASALRLVAPCLRRCAVFAVPFVLAGARHDPDW